MVWSTGSASDEERGLKVADSQVTHVTEANWQTEVLDSTIPVLVDFWAEWCGPCRALAPVLEALASEMAGRLKVAKVNVDEEPNLAARFRIQSIPTLLLVKNGAVQGQMVGAMPKAVLQQKLAAYL